MGAVMGFNLFSAQIKMMLSTLPSERVVEKYGPENMAEMRRIREQLANAVKTYDSGDKRGARRICVQMSRDLERLAGRCKALERAA